MIRVEGDHSVSLQTLRSQKATFPSGEPCPSSDRPATARSICLSALLSGERGKKHRKCNSKLRTESLAVHRLLGGIRSL